MIIETIQLKAKSSPNEGENKSSPNEEFPGFREKQKYSKWLDFLCPGTGGYVFHSEPTCITWQKWLMLKSILFVYRELEAC